MSSITTQQIKLDLELVPKENKIDIRKCNGRIPRGLTPREPTFQVVLDAIALTPCYLVFLITADVPEIFLRVHGREFDPLPCEEDTVSLLRELGHTGEINSLNDVVTMWNYFGKTSSTRLKIESTKSKKRCTTLVSPKLSFTTFLFKKSHSPRETKLGCTPPKHDYLSNSLRFVSAKESSQIYGAILPKCLTSPTMKESKAYKTYIGYATGEVPPKIARKFKKTSPTKKDSDLVPVDEEPFIKGKLVKRSVKKSSTNPATGIVIREPPVETKSKGKEKEKVDVARGAEKPPSVEKITPTVTSEGTGDKLGVPDVTEDDSTEKEEEVDQENESEDDMIESDDDKGIDDTTDQFDDDVDARLEEPTQIGKEVVQGEGADVEMNEAQQGNENLVTTQEQVVDDAHVTITTVTKKTEVPVTSSSRSSDFASKFLNFLDIPQTDAEIVTPLDVHVHHEVPRTQAPTLLTIPVSIISKSSPVLTNIPQVTTLEKEVAKLKKDRLHTQVTNLVDEHLDIRLGETIEEFMNFLSESLTARIKEQVKDQLP
ncbi:hypothetical protein Tco_1387786 [Tanacetum coccineum]